MLDKESTRLVVKTDKQMSKKNATEQLKRHIQNDILQGGTQKALVSRMVEDYYDVGYTLSEHSARDLIAKCRKELRDDWIEERKHLQEIQLQRLLDLYSESREAMDRMNALNTLKEVNKMTGLYPSEKLDVNANIKGDIVIDFGFNKEEETKDE